MEKVHRERKTSEGIVIPTISADFYGANILSVEAGTTGYCGGDSGHGCRTFIMLGDLGGTDMKARVITDSYGHTEKVMLMFSGDSELELLIKALRFIRKTLKKQTKLDDIPF